VEHVREDAVGLFENGAQVWSESARVDPVDGFIAEIAYPDEPPDGSGVNPRDARSRRQRVERQVACESGSGFSNALGTAPKERELVVGEPEIDRTAPPTASIKTGSTRSPLALKVAHGLGVTNACRRAVTR